MSQNPFTKYTQPKENPFAKYAQPEQTPVQDDQPGVISDLWSSFGVGAGNLVKAAGSLYGLATGDMDNGAVELGNVVTDYWQKEKSNVLKELEQGRKQAIDSGDSQLDKFGNAIWETVSNPRLLASFVSEQIPMFAAPGGAGAAGARAGTSLAARKGTEVAARHFGAKVGTAAGVGAGAAMQGGDVGANTYDELMALPEQIWEKNPEYLSLKDKLGDEQAAKEQIALDYGRKASAISGALSVGSQFIPGGATIEKAMAGNKFSGGLMGRAAKGFLGEGGQEIIEEGGGKVISNSFVSNVDENRDMLDGVGEASGLALLGGGVIGGGMAAISGKTDIEATKRQYDTQLNQLRSAGKKAVEQGDMQAAEQIDAKFAEVQANYDDFLRLNDPSFVKTNVQQQELAKEQVAQQGGDALDQANAAANVASSIADDVVKENDAKIQLQREQQAQFDAQFSTPAYQRNTGQQGLMSGEVGDRLIDRDQIRINPMEVWKPNFTMPGSEPKQAPDRTSELNAREQMRQAENAPRQIEQKDIIFGEDNRYRVGTDSATIRSNGNPFPTVKSVQASRSYRDAVEQGITPEIVKVGNGFGWEGVKDSKSQNDNSTVENAPPKKSSTTLSGDKLDDQWVSFNEQSETKGIPRSEMPQIKAEHRGAMVNFLKAKGIEHQKETVNADILKPTQQEFSEEKVNKAKGFEGGDRSILVSSDNHVLDGHHQWLAALDKGEEVGVIRLNSPIDELIPTALEFPSSTTDNDSSTAEADENIAENEPLISPPEEPKQQPPEGGFFTPEENQQDAIAGEREEVNTTLSTLDPVQRYDALWDKADQGDTSLTAEDLKGSYQALLQNEEAVKEQLNSLTKKQLLKYYNGFHDSGMRKQDLVNSAYNDMLKSYRFLGTTDEFVSSTMVFGAKGIERYDNVTKEIESITDEKLREVIATRKQRSDERKAEMKARVDGMKNPETLEDFRNAARYGLRKDFTNEQWAKYDRLVADEQMESQAQLAKREVQAFEGEVNYNLHQTTHSKKGHDLFVVEMVERLPSDKYRELNQKAKALGGYYSSYRRDGAIPGFQFPNEDARNEFVKVMNGENVTKTKQSKDKTDSLLGLAERIEAKANEELNRDRKTNTAKRAGEAASAIESAESNLVRAEKLKALANAIKNGETKYLNKMTAGTDQELLESLWNQIWYRARNNDEYTEDAGSGRWGRERKWKDGTTDEDKVRLAEYPLTNMYPGTVERVAKEMIETKGYALAGKSLLKLARSADNGSKQVNVLANKHHEKMMEFLRKNSETEYGREIAKDYMRIKRMGLNNLPTLRAAMLEYKSITDRVSEVNTNSAVKEKLKYEEIRGQYKDLDFFNSTDVVAKEAMSHLDLEEGMTVLEPSAGVGHLADAASGIVSKSNVTTNEFAYGLNEFLKEKGYTGTQGDFLELEPESKYDRVLMNPPFSKDQEITHIEHAYKFLKPGGKLVAVTSSMAGNRSNKRNQAFKAWMDEIGAYEVPLPEGAFKDAINPTNVNAKLIVIDKPEDSPMFSLGNDSGTTGARNRASVSSADANKVIDSIISSWKGSIKARRNEFVIAPTFDDLPNDIKDAAKEQGAEGKVYGVFHKGKTYVVLDVHRSTQELEETIFHETYGHHGMSKLFGEQITQKMNQLFVANGGMSGLRKTAEKHGIDLKLYEDGTSQAGMPKAVRNRVLMEELLAHMQQDNKPSVKRMAKEVVGYIRQKLRDLGFAQLANVSDSDLFYILKQSRDAVKKGKAESGEVRFMMGSSIEGVDKDIDNVTLKNIREKGENKEIFSIDGFDFKFVEEDDGFRLSIPHSLHWAKYSKDGELIGTGKDWITSPTEEELTSLNKAANQVSKKVKENESNFKNTFIRFNELPTNGRSKNHANGKLESGVSAFRSRFHKLKGVFELDESDNVQSDAHMSYVIDGANVYLVQGEEIGKGSDGEPLLKNTKILSALKYNPDYNGYVPTDIAMFRTTNETADTFTAPVEKKWSKDWFKRKLQDKFAPIADMQANIESVTGRELPEEQNTYRAEELFYGKTENDLNKMEENYVKPLVDAMTQNNIESGELDQYLIAKHAKERNAHIASINPEMPDGGSGMTNAEADEILQRYREEGKLAGLSIAANEVYKITEKRRELLRESGLEDDALLDVWNANYEFYVPLKGYAEDSEGKQVAGTGKGFDIRGRESMRAMGRRTIAESPTAHAIQDLSTTIIRARKNEVGQTFLNMVESNPNPDIWEVFTDENPDTERRIVNGEVKDNQPIDMRSRKDDYFSVKIDGQSKYIKLKDKDGLLMNAMKNMGPEQMNTFTKSMSAVTRWLSMVNTSLNPEFTVTNFTRDIQTALFNALAEQDLSDGKIKDKAIAKDMIKGTGKAVKSLWKHSAGKLDSNDPMYTWIEEFLADGAKTGYFDSKEVDKIGSDMADLLDIANGTNKGKLLKAKNKISNFVEGTNSGIENGVRLSAYIEARRAGVTRAKAASFAKNLTVNFNRKGEAGTFLNSLYMFFNAAVQGNVNFARAIITPKVDEITGKKSMNMAQKVAAGIATASFGWAALMREIGGDDDDGVPYWDKVPKGVRERNLVILKPGTDGEYYKIPLPYGYNIFYNIGDAAEAAVNSDTRNAGDLAGELALSVYASFVPLGSPVGDNGAESLALVAAPTITKPIVELATNKNFYGGEIYRENNPYGAQLRDSKMSMRSTGEAYKWMAQFMNDVAGDGRKYKVDGENPWYDVSPDAIEHLVEFSLGGLYRFGSRLYDNAVTAANGGDLPASDMPFARQLNGEIRPYSDISQFYDAREQLKNIDAELKSLRGKERIEFLDQYRDKYRLKGLMSSIDKRMKLLSKQRDRIETDQSLSFAEREKQLQAIEDKREAAVDIFNKRWNETN